MRCLPTLIAAFLVGCSLPSTAAAREPATQIAYVHGTQLVAVAPNGSHRRVLASVPKGVVDVAASADGRVFAFLVNHGVHLGVRGSDRAVYLLRVGGRPRALDVWHDFGPLSIAVSPQGDRVAYTRRSEIQVRRVADGGTVRITAAPGVAAEPAFAPDDDLVFSQTRTSPRGLYRISLRGGGAEELLAQGDFLEPAVSSAGLVAFRVSDHSSGKARLGLLRPLAAKPSFILRFDDPFKDGGPSFSPNGRRIAIFNQRETPRRLRYSIETVGLSGSGREVVLGDIGAGSVGPVWTAATPARR